MNALLLLVAALATWRVSSLLARERGMFALLTGVRRLVGVEHATDGTPAFDEDGELLLRVVTASARVDEVLHEIARGMTCIWCCSLWVAAGVALLVAQLQPLLIRDAATYGLVVFALSAAAIALDRVITE